MRRIGTLGALAVLAGCGGDGAGGSVAAVRDSAGITIVENGAAGSWGRGEGWSLTPEPVLQLGGDGADPAFEFDRVTGAVRLSDGTLAVANGGTNEIRFYDAAGAHRTTSGRAGSGPGEYTAIAAFWRTDTDSLVVLDVLVRRLTVIGPDGGYGRSFHLGGLGGAMIPGADGNVSLAMPAGMLRDGSLIGVSMGFQINDQREGAYRDSMPAIHFGPDGAILDTLAWFPGIEMEQTTLTFGAQSVSVPTAVPMGRNSIMLASRNRLYVATNAAWEVEVWEPGRGLVELLRVSRPPRPLDPSGVATHRKEQIELMDAQSGGMLPAPMRDQMVDRINSAAYPATLPFVANILMDGAGNLWVQEQDQPGDRSPRFGVFDSDGRLLGWVDMPERFRPTQITADAVVGIWQDADDVEHIRVYGLRKG